MSSYLGQSVISSEIAQQPKVAQSHRGARARETQKAGLHSQELQQQAPKGPALRLVSCCGWKGPNSRPAGSDYGKVRVLDRFTWKYSPLTLGEKAVTLCISCVCVCVCVWPSGAVHLCSDKVSLTCLQLTTLLRLAGHHAPGTCPPHAFLAWGLEAYLNAQLFNTGSGDQTPACVART